MALNYKIENATERFFEKVDGSHVYKYKGKEYEMTPKNLLTYPRDLQQSFGHYCAKECPQPVKIPKPAISKTNSTNKRGRTYDPEKIHNSQVKKLEKAVNFLKRIARSEKLVEEKLNYPKVFQALLTEPHTAFDHKRKTVEEHFNLTLFVDIAIGYMNEGFMTNGFDSSIANTLIKAAEKVKGVTVFSSHALTKLKWKDKYYNYWTDLLADLPRSYQKNVLVFTQGCGTYGHYENTPEKAARFCTPFAHGRNCGCGQIKKAESAGQIMFYDINNVDKLSLIK